MKQFDIMLQANVITKKQYDLLITIEKQTVDWNKLDQERFLMHLAMVLVRMAKNESVSSLSKVVKQQIETSPFYQQANIYLNKLFNKTGLIFPHAELNYLQMHVINFLNKETN